jgi:hypothetical protein
MKASHLLYSIVVVLFFLPFPLFFFAIGWDDFFKKLSWMSQYEWLGHIFHQD